MAQRSHTWADTVADLRAEIIGLQVENDLLRRQCDEARATGASVPGVLLTVPEAATMLRRSRSMTYADAAAGRLPGIIRLGDRSIRVHRPTLEKWLAEQAAQR